MFGLDEFAEERGECGASSGAVFAFGEYIRDNALFVWFEPEGSGSSVAALSLGFCLVWHVFSVPSVSCVVLRLGIIPNLELRCRVECGLLHLSRRPRRSDRPTQGVMSWWCVS